MSNLYRRLAIPVLLRIKNLLFLIIAVGWQDAAGQLGTWSYRGEFPATAREHSIGFTINGKTYIGMGSDYFTGFGSFGDLWEYDPTTGVWTQKASLPGSPRSGATAFSIAQKGYVVAGYDNGPGTFLYDVWEYDPILDSWTQKSDAPFTARRDAVGFSIGSKGYVGTGQRFGFEFADFYEYDPVNDLWTQISDFPGFARQGMVGFPLGDKGYVGTGWRAGWGATDEFWEFDPGLNVWTQKANVGGGPRYGAMGASVHNRGYVGGGIAKTDLWSYNPWTNTWLQKSDLPVQRYLPVSLGVNGRVLVVTGNIFDNSYWEYNPGIPVISSFTPTSGLAGADITINGENFNDWDRANNIVTFNGVQATVQSVTLTSLQVRVPSGATTGPIKVSVFGEEGISMLPFTVIYQPPRIYSISPTQGPAGSIVTINGDNFDLQPNGNTVYFGGVQSNVVTASPTQLTVEVPIGASYGPISVLSNGLTAYSQKNFVLTFPAGAISYLPEVEYATNGGPNFVSSGDLDGDGVLDLAVVTQFFNKVDILRNTSSGPGLVSFAVDGGLPISFPPTVAVGDIDGDGKLDAVAVNGLSNTVSVFRNSVTGPGTISFAGATNFSTDNIPLGVAIRDLDYDGRLDLAVTTQANTVSVFLNTGTGPGIISFAPKVDFATGQAPVSPQIADLDGDGAPDLIVANINSNTISVFRNMSGGPGSIAFSRSDLATGFSSVPGSLSIGDLDNDGKHEIVVANEGNATAAVFRNQGFPGSINFAARTDFAVGSFPKSVAIADLNGDGRPDMAVTNSSSKSISVFRNTSTAIGMVSFAPKVDLAVDSNPFGLSLADMDRDGKPDLVVTKPFSSTVAVLTNRVPPPKSVTTADSLALASLYQSTSGPGWTNRTNWLSGSVNTWHGVTVTAGRVQSLSLSGNNLIGSLPTTLGDLTGLENLDLSANSISGSVPASLGGLVLVSHLDLSNNSLTGPLPAGMGNLNQLISLRLNKNQLSGAIPSGVGSFSGLVTIALEENHFTSLPAFASTGIVQLSVGTNDLTFEDLEPNIGKSGFSYAPQGQIPGLPQKEIYQIQTLTLGYALGGTANQYQWSKDGVAIAGATSNPFVKPNSLPSDAGSYTLQITSSLVPGLVLTTGPTTVTVQPVATGFTFQPTNGSINSLALDPVTETLYFGGSFSLVNLPVTGPFVPVDKTHGLPQIGFPKVNGGVRRIVPDGAGGFIITGSFTSIGGLSRNTIAKVDGAGNVTSWNPNPNGGGVNDVAVAGNIVYVSGGFTSIGGVSRQGLAAIDLTTGATLGWDPAGVLAGASIYSIAVGSGQLYVAGYFTGSFGGQTRNHAAALDLTTGALTSWNPNVGNEGIGGNRGVLCIHFDGTKVFLGGFFERVGGVGRVNVAAVDPISGALLGWNAGLFYDFIYTSVTAMNVVGNTLYLAGTFRQIVGQGRQGFAAVDATTGALTGWNPGRIDTSNGAVSLIESAGKIYVAGSAFFLAGPSGNEYRAGIAAIDAATGIVTPWNPNPNAHVSALGNLGGSILMGGGFNTVGGMPRNNLAGLDINTGIINDWNPAPDGVVSTLAYNDGKVYVGGSFNSIGGQSRSKLAAVSATTGLSANWNPSPTPAASSYISSIAVAGNSVYAGGFFTSIGGQSRNRIAALDIVTGAASSWNPNTNQNIRSISIGQAAVYAGGDFTTIGGQSRRFLAALDQVTGAATSWNPDPFGGVATVVASCNTIYVGGTFFTSIGGQPRNRLAAIDAGTGLASSWNPNPTGGSFGSTSVLALAKSGNIVYAGGDFYTMGGQTRNYVAAIDAITGTPTTWDPNANGVVRAILTHEDKVYVAGDFSTLFMPSGWSGMTNSFLSKLDGNASSIPTITSISPLGGLPGTVVTISGTNFDLAPPNNTVTFNGATASVLSSSTNMIDVLVPVGATTGRIIVTVGCSSAMSGSDFTVGSGNISISPQPLSSTVCEGNSATMTVSANGTTNLIYKWQKFDGSAYVNIVDGGGYSGSTTTTLSINTTGNFGAGDYRCKISGDLAPDVFSNVGTLTVKPNPSPPTTPVGGTSCGSGSLTISVAGGSPGEYRWYIASTGGTPIVGEMNETYNTPLLTATTTYHVAINNGNCESGRTPVTATINPGPSNPITASVSRCDVGAVTLSTTGAGPGQYRWYTAASGGVALTGELNDTYTTPSLTSTATYYVSINNGTCESNRAPVTATINPLPADPTTTSASRCDSGSTTLTASGGSPGQYRWYTQATGGTPIAGEVNDTYATPSLMSTTTYYVSVNNGTCESDRTAVIATINTAPVAPATTPFSRCDVGSVSLSATGGSTGQYRWYTQATGGTAISGEVNDTYATPSLTSTTTYYVSIDNGTCEGNRTAVTATINPIPSTPNTTGASRCDIGMVALTASGGSAGEYRWYATATGGTPIAGEVNDTFTTPTLTATTAYYVSINNGTCESNRAPVTATINTIPANPTPTGASRCGAGTVTLTAAGAAPGQYRWYTALTGGLPLSGEVNSTFVTPALPTSTDFYVSINDGLCESGRAAVTATINPVPPAPTTTSPSRCGPGSVSFTAAGGAAGQYRWYSLPTGGTAIPGEVNNTYTVNLTGTTSFYVAILEVGCESNRTEVVGTILSVPAIPTVTSSVPITNNQLELCPSTSATLTAPAGFAAYTWSTGSTGATTTVSQPGSVTLTVRNSDGCTSAPFALTVVSRSCAPAIAPPPPQTIPVEGQLNINVTALITSVLPIVPASLRVTIAPASGARASFSPSGELRIDYSGVLFAGRDVLTIEVCNIAGECAQQQISIEVVGDIVVFNGISPNGDGENEFFYIQYIDVLPAARENQVSIFNRWGDLVWQTRNYDNIGNRFEGKNSSGGELPSGTYYYRIQFASGVSERAGYLSLKR